MHWEWHKGLNKAVCGWEILPSTMDPNHFAMVHAVTKDFHPYDMDDEIMRDLVVWGIVECAWSDVEAAPGHPQSEMCRLSPAWLAFMERIEA